MCSNADMKFLWAVRMRKCIEVCCLLDNQRDQVKNAYLHRAAVIKHLFTTVIPYALEPGGAPASAVAIPILACRRHSGVLAGCRSLTTTRRKSGASGPASRCGTRRRPTYSGRVICCAGITSPSRCR